jgi:CheY-like chemotaxis protein
VNDLAHGVAVEAEQGESAEKAKILLVDDEPKSLYALQELLSTLEQNLMVAQSGEEALRLALRNDFAVILLDVRMPGIDGFETARLIRSRERSRSTPIIFLTAAADEMT